MHLAVMLEVLASLSPLRLMDQGSLKSPNSVLQHFMVLYALYASFSVVILSGILIKSTDI